jgi:fumarylacetoacetate (FAA) hydrolase family protein
VLANSSAERRDDRAPWFLAPCDLAAIKAAGVTFVSSMLERVIEEAAGGDASKAQSARAAIVAVIGDDLARIRPGSPEADSSKRSMTAPMPGSQLSVPAWPAATSAPRLVRFSPT